MKILKIILISLLLTACNYNFDGPEKTPVQSAPSDLPQTTDEPDPNEPAKGYDIKYQPIDKALKLETTTLLDVKDEKAFPYYTFIFKDEFWQINTEKYSGKAEFTLEDGNKIAFVVNYYDDDPMVDIIVNDQNAYSLNAWINEFFSYTFVFPNNKEFYAFDGGGHEGIADHYYYDGHFLIDYREVMKEKLGDEFKTDYVFPPFSIYVTPSYLKIIEERYCCDVTYDSNDSDRAKYYKFFIFNRENLELLEAGKFERGISN